MKLATIAIVFLAIHAVADLCRLRKAPVGQINVGCPDEIGCMRFLNMSEATDVCSAVPSCGGLVECPYNDCDHGYELRTSTVGAGETGEVGWLC